MKRLSEGVRLSKSWPSPPFPGKNQLFQSLVASPTSNSRVCVWWSPFPSVWKASAVGLQSFPALSVSGFPLEMNELSSARLQVFVSLWRHSISEELNQPGLPLGNALWLRHLRWRSLSLSRSGWESFEAKLGKCEKFRLGVVVTKRVRCVKLIKAFNLYWK